MTTTDDNTTSKGEKSQAPSAGFTRIPNKLINDSRVTPYDRSTYIAIKSFGKQCFARHNVIAQRAGMKRAKLIVCIKNLIKYGYIVEVSRIAGGVVTYQSTAYPVYIIDNPVYIIDNPVYIIDNPVYDIDNMKKKKNNKKKNSTKSADSGINRDGIISDMNIKHTPVWRAEMEKLRKVIDKKAVRE